MESRARILPEERLETATLLGDAGAVEKLIRQERPGIAEQRQLYLYRQAPTRNPVFVTELQQIYEGRCQLCLWSPRIRYKVNLCQGHHLHWLSRGGEDELNNIVLVCPNHHAAIHKVDAPFDYKDYSFDFGTHKEVIKLNRHL